MGREATDQHRLIPPAAEQNEPQLAATSQKSGRQADSGATAISPVSSDILVRQTLDRLGSATVCGGALVRLVTTDPKDVEAVIDTIRLAPSLAARVLSVVNSAAYGISRQITTVRRAVILLGSMRARTVAMPHGLRLLTERSGLPDDVVETVWANSLRKACAAQRFCRLHAPEATDAAYCLGLIQDIGLPMLMAVDLDYYTNKINIASQQTSWSAQERARFGFDHAALGYEMLRSWSADESLRESVRYHHRSPKGLGKDEGSVLRLATFLAGLMPHMTEAPTPRAIDWIQAVHAKFLADESASPEDFFRQIDEERAGMGLGLIYDAEKYTEDRLIYALTRQVASNAIGVTAKLCYLEHRKKNETRGITDLKLQAFTDGLTKVLNRRGFIELGSRRLEAAAKQGVGVCCMLSDLDHFKEVNDRYGHDAGDQVLRGLAKLMRRQLADHDLVGRIGGDEFAVLVSGITAEEARQTAQRLVDSIRTKALRVRPDIRIDVRLSLGAVYYAPEQSTIGIDELLRLADKAMYRQKGAGRDGLCFASYPPGDPIEQTKDNPESKTRHLTR